MSMVRALALYMVVLSAFGLFNQSASADQKSDLKTAKTTVDKEHLKAIVRKYALAQNVPVKLAQAVARIESNYRPWVTGPKGSVGMMQIKYTTAQDFGYKGTRKELYDPETNVKYAMKYLSGAFRRAKGDICGTVFRYNAGYYAKRMNPISARYCKRAIAMVGRKHIPNAIRHAHASVPLPSLVPRPIHVARKVTLAQQPKYTPVRLAMLGDAIPSMRISLESTGKWTNFSRQAETAKLKTEQTKTAAQAHEIAKLQKQIEQLNEQVKKQRSEAMKPKNNFWARLAALGEAFADLVYLA